MKSTCLALSLVFLFSCNNTKKETIPVLEKIDGKDIFNNRCTSCHGMNGKLGFSGAKDLTKSLLTITQIEYQVTNGKGAMTPFKNILTIEEISAVAIYCKTFQQK